MSVGAEYRALAARMQSLPEQIVRAGIAEMQPAIIARLRADTGGDLVVGRAPRNKRRRPRLGVTAKVQPGRHITTATLTPSPKRGRQSWSWLEFGTREHDVGVRRDGNGGLHMFIGGEWRTGPWHVSGSSPKYTYSRGVETSTRRTEQAMSRTWERGLR